MEENQTQEKNEFAVPAQEMLSATKDYIDIRTDEAKLDITEGLSKGFGKILSAIMILQMVVVVLALLSAALIMWLGSLIGNNVAAAFIVTGLYALIPILIYMLRNKVFVRAFEKIFLAVFFSDKDIHDIPTARAQFETQRKYKEQELSLRGKYLKAFYSPANVMSTLMHKSSIIAMIAGFLAEIVAKFRSITNKDKEAQSDAQSETQTEPRSDAGAESASTTPDSKSCE